MILTSTISNQNPDSYETSSQIEVSRAVESYIIDLNGPMNSSLQNVDKIDNIVTFEEKIISSKGKPSNDEIMESNGTFDQSIMNDTLGLIPKNSSGNKHTSSIESKTEDVFSVLLADTK